MTTKPDLFEAPLMLSELEGYLLVCAMQIASEHTKASEETRWLQARVRCFVLKHWPDPTKGNPLVDGRINVDVRTFNEVLADAQRYRTMFEPENILAVSGLVERSKREADAALDALARRGK